MNKQTAKNCILSSIAATMFIGFGFGIVIASTIPVISLCGFVTGIISLIVMFALVRKVEKAGYEIKMIKEGDRDE